MKLRVFSLVRLVTAFVLIFSSFSQSWATEINLCESALLEAKLFDRTVSFTRISESQLKFGKISTVQFDDKTAVFIGINPLGHTYLVTGGFRYDGKQFFKPEFRQINNLDRGFVIRIDDGTGQLRDAMIAALKDSGRTLTCVSGLCSAFNQAPVPLTPGGEKLKVWTPEQLLKNFVEFQSMALANAGVKVDFYIIGDREIDYLMREMKYATTHAPILRWPLRIGIGLGVVGGGITLLIKLF